MPKWLRALLQALGLVKRKPTPTPKPKPQPPPEPPPPPLVFNGLMLLKTWIEWHELVWLYLGYQVHGCGPDALAYGIKDPLKRKLTFEFHIQRQGEDEEDSVFTKDGLRCNGIPTPGDSFYWFAGHTGPRPIIPLREQRILAEKGCCPPPPPPPKPKPAATVTTRIAITIRDPHGQQLLWHADYQVARSSCT